MTRVIHIATNTKHEIVGVWWKGCIQPYNAWKIAVLGPFIGACYIEKVKFEV